MVEGIALFSTSKIRLAMWDYHSINSGKNTEQKAKILRRKTQISLDHSHLSKRKKAGQFLQEM